jgi:tetratricopeptide (TPR) repeat protein
MALVYFDNYEYAKAEPLFVRALAIAEKALGTDNSELALNFNNLGMFYVRWGRYAEAQPLLERALELEKGAAELTDFFYATILNNLAELHLGLGNYVAAEDLCIEGLEMREQIGNPEKTGRSYITMAAILHRKGDYTDSDTFFRKAVENRELVYGSEHPELLHTLKRYVELLQSTGRDEAAGLIQSRIEAIRTKYSIRDV